MKIEALPRRPEIRIRRDERATPADELIRRRHFKQDSKIPYTQTGGAPSLFAYQSMLQS